MDRSGLFPIIVSYLPKLIESIIYALLLFVCFNFLILCIHTSLVCVLRLLRILLLFVHSTLYIYLNTSLVRALTSTYIKIYYFFSSLFKCVMCVCVCVCVSACLFLLFIFNWTTMASTVPMVIFLWSQSLQYHCDRIGSQDHPSGLFVRD